MHAWCHIKRKKNQVQNAKKLLMLYVMGRKKETPFILTIADHWGFDCYSQLN